MAAKTPSDGLKQSLGRALEHQRDRRASNRRSHATKPKPPKPLLEQQASERTMVNQIVSKEAQRHGIYRPVDFKLQEVTEQGKRVDKTIRVVRNVGGSPIDRWHARNGLDERQMAAILFYQEAFRKVFGEGPKVTASYSPVIIRGQRSAVELWAGSTMAAREALRLLDQEVFFREPVEYFQVWQNIVIFEKPAGVAGAGVGFVVKKAAEARAKVIVCSMAHKVADIVIDQSRADYRDLLLDLDAPRRPGRRP